MPGRVLGTGKSSNLDRQNPCSHKPYILGGSGRQQMDTDIRKFQTELHAMKIKPSHVIQMGGTSFYAVVCGVLLEQH